MGAGFGCLQEQSDKLSWKSTGAAAPVTPVLTRALCSRWLKYWDNFSGNTANKSFIVIPMGQWMCWGTVTPNLVCQSKMSNPNSFYQIGEIISDLSKNVSN